MKRWIEYAEILGAPVIRVFAGHQKQGVKLEETHKLIVDGLQLSCEYAETGRGADHQRLCHAGLQPAVFP